MVVPSIVLNCFWKFFTLIAYYSIFNLPCLPIVMIFIYFIRFICFFTNYILYNITF